MRHEALERRLRSVGLDPGAIGDAVAAWQRLHEAFGTAVTIADRYDLEAAARGVPVAALSGEDRSELALEVLALRSAGMELIGSSPGDPIRVVAYDPAWPGRFRSWRDRLAGALGPAALRIDHVGSTAIPGLPAKPVIDVQVSVADVEDEDAYVAAVEAVGVPLRMREAGHRYFRPETREVQVHVCAAGGPWERDHLLFRDFLRARPDMRDDYAALKLALAERFGDDRLAYNDAKTAFILDVVARAGDWAQATGWEVSAAHSG
jgi:GrpB-like predicted nucleotidyltransferase (UPF0157 family)